MMRKALLGCCAVLLLAVPADLRADPYKSYKYHLIWHGHAVAGFTDGRNLRTGWEGVTLDRGITNDPAFDNWTKLEHGPAPCSIEVANEAGVVQETYGFAACSLQSIAALPADTTGHAMAIAHLKLIVSGGRQRPPRPHG